MTWTKRSGRFWLVLALILLLGAAFYWWTRRISDPGPSDVTSAAIKVDGAPTTA